MAARAANVKDVVKTIRKESKDVDMWREIVTGMLVITAAMVTVTTYVLLSRQEVQEFASGVSMLEMIHKYRVVWTALKCFKI